jgi:hypothetical protein
MGEQTRFWAAILLVLALVSVAGATASSTIVLAVDGMT